MKKKELCPAVIRVALYIRVSGEEQKIKGLSLEAQQERLETYAKEHGWIITGTYIDAAKTARKNLHKRTEFQRMMESVKRNEVDILLFARLDRWFRSVADYYKVMEILQAHNCNWKTTDEEYDTTTANGRLYINVKLSIAQNDDCPPMRGFYRWHLMDPICFEEDLKVTIQQIGVCYKGLFERQDDVASVAYWYQSEPHQAFAPLMDKKGRWPR